MRLVDIAARPGQPIDSFSSTGFEALVFAEGARVTLCRLAPGGAIGRHTAPADQLFVVLDGSANIAGPSEELSVGTGQAVLFDAPDDHTTTTSDGLLAVIVERPGLAEQF